MKKLFITLIITAPLIAMDAPCKKIKRAPLTEQIEYHQTQPNLLIRPCMKATKEGDIETVRALLGHINLNTENASEESLLTKAAQENHLNIIETLLDSGRINLKSQGSIQALLWATQHGNQFMVRKLVNVGISVNSKDSLTGYTPLMMAVYKNNKTLTCLLLSHNNIDVTIKNSDGDTAWSLAVKLKH